MAKNIQIKFPRYIDRPRLLWVFETDTIVYTAIVSVSISGLFFVFFQNPFSFFLPLFFFVPYVGYVIAEIKKTEGARGAVQYAMYVAGYIRNIPKPKELNAHPDLKRMDTLDFMPLGNENYFIS